MESTTTTSTTDAQRAIERRGVATHVIAEELSKTPDLVGAWAAYGKRNPKMGPGALVKAIRSGHMPPERHRPGVTRGDTDRIPEWLAEHFPDLSDEHGNPHPAAVLAARRMKFRHGELSAREHAQAIRGAVEDAEAEER